MKADVRVSVSYTAVLQFTRWLATNARYCQLERGHLQNNFVEGNMYTVLGEMLYNQDTLI